MAIIKIDGVDYDTNKLNKEALEHINFVVLSDEQVNKLKIELAIVQTARNAYANKLKVMLAKAEEIKFN